MDNQTPGAGIRQLQLEKPMENQKQTLNQPTTEEIIKKPGKPFACILDNS
jgi:hypothetical protein